MNRIYDSDWVLAVLNDLTAFAAANDLEITESALREALSKAQEEICGTHSETIPAGELRLH